MDCHSLFPRGLGLALIVVAGPLRAQDATMFRNGPAHTGVYQDSGIATFTAVKWRFHTEGKIIGSPAIVGRAAYVGSTDGNVYAVDLDRGTMRWKFATKGRVTSSPAVAGGLVYVESYDGNLYALDATKGTLAWKFATAGERRFAATHLHGVLPVAERMPDPFDIYLSSPAVWQGSVYFGSGDGNIYALDAVTGKLKWTYRTGDVVHASPAIANGLLYIGSWDSYFYALDAHTGALVWRFRTGQDTVIHNQVGIQSSAAIADGVVYFGCRDAQLYALDARTGAKKWSFDNQGSWVVSSPAVRDGTVYFGTSDSRHVWALDAKTGKPVFSLPTRWYIFGSPALAGNWLYVGSWDGTLTAIDLTTHKPVWVYATDASRANLPPHLTKDGAIDFDGPNVEPFYDEMVAAVEQHFTVGSIVSSPVVADHVLYVGSADGNLYAIR
jgi:outer membrane protein assembly factor BamB